MVLEFVEAHWKTSERRGAGGGGGSSSHMLLVHEFEYLKGNLEKRWLPVLLIDSGH